ncbi:MAG: DUF1987 domain-containing protein [SAR324 cluster bacterium]|nr:DUF1987 domain-containing protein [SAR324 cluster bacterium]
MDCLEIAATKYTPAIAFDNKQHVLEILGKSYPENTVAFYEPVFTWLEEYLEQVEDNAITVNLEIIYFNSSSAKVLMDLFDTFEEAAEEGKHITINWIYDEENESALEYGEEFQEDYEAVIFNLVKKTE